jgi:hypothetical protein
MDGGGTSMMRRVLFLIAALAALALLPATAQAKDKTVWLCKPGIAKNPCAPSLKTTKYANDGSVLGVNTPKTDKKPKIDCFYVYPTVSDDKTDNSDLSIDPEERSIALYQAARYSQECRVFAPMYKQVTITRLLQGPDTITPQMRKTAYDSFLQGWKTYLKKYNDGRPFVLIGHSQGSFTLRKLIADQIDPNKTLRKQLVSAILLGGNVVVKKGKDSGGDFKHVKACRSQTQIGCVVAWSTFNAPVPSDSLFGRTNGQLDTPTNPNLAILCAYPGSNKLQTIIPSAPFAPGTTIGLATLLVGFPTPSQSTPWAEYDQAYRGGCSSAGGANVLQITDQPGAPHLNAVPDATWGLHLADANIALGNLTALVRKETKAYFK